MKHFDPQFTAYLQDKNYTLKTIESTCIKAYYYQSWLNTKRITIQKASYSDLMNHVGYLQKQKQKTKGIVNDHIRAIGHYYQYLKLPNIAHKIKIIGSQKQTPLLLTAEELQQIYEAYTGYVYNSYTSYSNKILVGLFIYQAVDIQDLVKLELKDINLEKGIIYLPAGINKKNSRTLRLEVHQIMDLHHYITKYRNKNKLPYHDGTTDLLFSPQAEKKHRLISQCRRINKMLKEQSLTQQISYKNLPQLRQSRIAIWIKQYGVRKAMYLSGRKRASNIERLKQVDLEQLTKHIEKFHPLG